MTTFRRRRRGPSDRFDENGERNKQSTESPGSWGIGSRTFVESVAVELCEDNTPSTPDYLGRVFFDSASVPPVGTDEVTITDDFGFDPDADDFYEYRIRTEDHATQAASCP